MHSSDIPVGIPFCHVGTGRYAYVPLQIAKSGYVGNRRKSDGNRSILETPDREARSGPSILSGTLGTAADNAQFYSGSRFLIYRVCLKLRLLMPRWGGAPQGVSLSSRSPHLHLDKLTYFFSYIMRDVPIRL
jgi:hypothetical protein